LKRRREGVKRRGEGRRVEVGGEGRRGEERGSSLTQFY
jgi:hypothetical protein